jgi:hypothetical protein
MLEPDVPVTVTGSIAAILTIIEAARAARRFPVILELLTDGSMTLTTVCLLASHLTAGNYREALEQARHKSKREIEQLIAAMCPRPAVPSVIRKLPDPTAPPALNWNRRQRFARRVVCQSVMLRRTMSQHRCVRRPPS